MTIKQKVSKELRFKRYTKTDKHLHDPLLASTHVEEEDILNYDKTDVKGRNKRGLVAFLPLIGQNSNYCS